jgi:sugar-specific transcriptional regulator TrmB
MKNAIVAELTQLGLTPTEAQVYLALAQNGAMGARAIASATGLARTSVYPTLGSLVDKGLVDAGGKGYGSRFSAVPADRALAHLMVSDKEALLQREQLTNDVIGRISSLEEPVETASHELIQVIRSPRTVADRFERLHLEAKREIQGFVKSPLLLTSPENRAKKKAHRRGVRVRVIYEHAAITEDPLVKHYLATWVAGGEEARIYQGELPHKLRIFDHETVMMPLLMPGDQTRTLLIRHKHLAASLSMLFEFLWERSEPLASHAEIRKKAIKSPPKPPEESHAAVLVSSRNGRGKRPSRA